MALLTIEQLEELRKIIRDASTAIAISTTGLQVSDEALQQLVDNGWLDPAHIEDVVLDNYELGRLISRLPEAANFDYQQFRQELQARPMAMSTQEKRAVGYAQTRAGQFCVGLGNRLSGDLDQRVFALDAELEQRQREGIQTEVALAIEQKKSIRALESDLRKIADDMSRDWRRIASTEMHLAHETGYMDAEVARHGPEVMMAKTVAPDACPKCRELYLDADGKPKIRPASWWAAQGLTNVGRKKSDWKPVIGPCHPFCGCVGTRVPSGFVFDEDNNLVPAEEEEEKSLVRENQTTKEVQKAGIGYLTPGGTFSGSSGSQNLNRWKNVNQMSFWGDPKASAPGNNPYAARVQEDHPGSQKQRRKRKKKQFTPEGQSKPETIQERKITVGKTIQQMEGRAVGHEVYHTPIYDDPQRGAKEHRKWVEDEQQRRVDFAHHTNVRLSINPKLLRRSVQS